MSECVAKFMASASAVVVVLAVLGIAACVVVVVVESVREIRRHKPGVGTKGRT
jgi:hypothetical protein